MHFSFSIGSSLGSRLVSLRVTQLMLFVVSCFSIVSRKTNALTPKMFGREIGKHPFHHSFSGGLFQKK